MTVFKSNFVLATSQQLDHTHYIFLSYRSAVQTLLQASILSNIGIEGLVRSPNSIGQ